MTIDDNSSIYVGGLAYEVTEETLRKVFSFYGAVQAVKIINDRNIGGKCYGFVTFANPRSAMQAIEEMNGKSIDGRPVKVNEVRTRGGRPFFERGNGSDRDRERFRDDSYDRRHHYMGHRRRFQGDDRDRERGHDYQRDHYLDEDDYDRMEDEVDLEPGRKHELGWDREGEQQMSKHKIADEERLPGKRSRFDDHGSTELSLDSLNDNQYQSEGHLAASSQKLQELRKEVSHIDELVANKLDVVSRLKEKYQKLEDSLISAKKISSYRHTQLAKLSKCYAQMRDFEDRFKNSEVELQALVDSTMTELGNDGSGSRDGIVANGRA